MVSAYNITELATAPVKTILERSDHPES